MVEWRRLSVHDVKGGDLECCRVDIRCVVDCRCVLMAIVADTEFGRKEGAFDLLPYRFDLPYRIDVDGPG